MYIYCERDKQTRMRARERERDETREKGQAIESNATSQNYNFILSGWVELC